jgi:hypothetical protein
MLSRRVLTIPDWAANSGLEQIHTGWPECDSEAGGCKRQDLMRQPKNGTSGKRVESAECKSRAIAFPTMSRDNGIVPYLLVFSVIHDLLMPSRKHQKPGQ